jgi:hypothetical protein
MLQKVCHRLQYFSRKRVIRYGAGQRHRTDESAESQDRSRPYRALVLAWQQPGKQLKVIPDLFSGKRASPLVARTVLPGRKPAKVRVTCAVRYATGIPAAPAIGGSVGNAVTQLARALGAKHAISSTTSHVKAEQAKALGFNEVIDTSIEKLGDGVRRITGGYGADIVNDGIGGEVLSEALGALALGGSLITLGYSASRKTTIDVTNLIVPQTSIRGFNMFSQPQAAVADAWNVIVSLLQSGAIKPIVAKTFPLAEAADALRYLVEGRPFGRVVLTI